MTPSLVCVDAGHGGSDPGAVAGGHHEKDLALTHALALGAALERVGCGVLYTRTTDRALDLAARARAANDAKAELFISVHCNSSVSSQPSGAWVIHEQGDEVSQRLAERVAGFLDANIRPAEPGDAVAHPDKSGWTGDRSLYVLRGTHMPAILVEIGFISNEKDRARMLDAYHTELTSAAIAAEVARAFVLRTLVRT
jgi:N-acetylmuramoyl-L-alanine amidase